MWTGGLLWRATWLFILRKYLRRYVKKKKKKVYVYDNHSANYNNAYGKQPKDEQ